MSTGHPIPTPDTRTPTPGLATLLTWFSPAFPLGAFAYSHGLEAAVAQGGVRDGASTRGWIETLLEAGSFWNDLVLLAQGLRLAGEGDEAGLAELSDLAIALAGSAERRLEAEALGTAFTAAVRPWAGEITPGAYPVAVARAAHASGAARDDVLLAFAHGQAANLVSAAVRLVPLGQSEAVQVLHELEPSIRDAAQRTAVSELDDLGSHALLSEIAAMRHETLTTRLFRS
ncbi:urease accessory protein UreF [Aureimonas mangrovi]|uniref:urease accessory protein UreF n=1 Tax=Aureimonas mangrovi TaxID=2758041 RepID=UPI00163D64C2|nr:urease accessory protein UreF [Aureimonas mangrovi]